MKTLILILIASAAVAEVKFVPMPKYPAPDEQLAAWRELAGTPRNIAMYASQRVLQGAIPADGPAKPYRDNATQWNFGRTTFEYMVCCEGEIRLRLRSRQSDAGVVVTDVEGITQLEGLFDGEVIAFYNRRVLQSNGAEFSRIPRPVMVSMPAAEAARLSIYNPPAPIEVKWPMGQPLGSALRFHPVSGEIEAFNALEYEREFPVVTGKLPDQELVDAVSSILDSRMSTTEKARAIRLAAK